MFPRVFICLVLAVTLGACGTTARRDAPIPPTMEKDASGRYYLDDGPGPNPPADLDRIPDAVPKLEPLHRGASRPYTVMGRAFMPMTTLARYKARGTATWYGRRYHGKPTSSGEIYDMYAMTAAHTTLPIPSYARVTNLANGKSVVVRINDRGPFVGDRLIDLSYTAAHRLGLVAEGSGWVEVETLLPGDALAEKLAAAPASPVRESGPRSAPREAAPAAVPLAVASATAPPAAISLAAGENTPLPAPTSNSQAASAGAVTAAPTAERPQSAARGVYIQFGAFRSRENAESLLGRLRQQWEWLAARLQIHPRDGLYRVHAGPYASQTEARQVANRVGDALGPKPVLLNW